MPFVYEPLDEKARAELEAKVRKFQTVLSMTPAQIIDRARDIVFLGLGGQGDAPPIRGEPPNYYAMFWKGSRIAMEGHHKLQSAGGVVTVTVTLTQLTMPDDRRSELPEIQRSAQEAMELYWSNLHRLPISVTLHFPAPVYY